MNDDKPRLPGRNALQGDAEARYWRTGETAWQSNYGVSAFGPSTISDSGWVASQPSTFDAPRSVLGRVQALRSRGPRSDGGLAAVVILGLAVVAAALLMARWA